MELHYELKDVGPCHTVLRCVQTEEGVYVHQIPYIEQLVREYLSGDVTYGPKAETPKEGEASAGSTRSRRLHQTGTPTPSVQRTALKSDVDCCGDNAGHFICGFCISCV